MSTADASLVRDLQARMPVTEEQRLRREVAHKEQLIATQFIEDGRHSRKVRKLEWVSLVGALVAMMAILLVILT